MNLKLRLLIFIFLFPHLEAFCHVNDPISRMRHGYIKYSEDHIYHTKFCTKRTSCLCKPTTVGYFYQCDSLLYASFHSHERALNIYCKETVRKEDISGHMVYLSEIAAEYHIDLILDDCPPDSTSDFRYPAQINKLKLKCTDRKDFTLAPDQFQNLSRLKSLSISCASLRNLPEAIFKTINPSLRIIEIEETLIERLGKGLLSNLSNLRHLEFINNEKLSLRKTDFTGLHSLQVLEIKKSHSQEIEEDLFQPIYHIHYLAISDSGCRSLPKSFTILLELRYLIISKTFIEWIGNGTCRKQDNIDEIIIESNPFLDIHPDCLQMYKNSVEIDLSGNRISSLPSREILLNRLKTFKLNDNGRDINTVESFIHSKTLTKIEMRNSSIHSMHRDFFRNIPNIKEIDLSNNQITYLPKGFFELNEFLERVLLRDNKLTSIPESLLDIKPFLTRIDISHNDISEVDFNVSQNLSSLRKFDISNNKLTRIPQDPFSSMPEIIHFNVSNNKISHIDTFALQTMSKVKELLIGGNMMKGKFFPYQQNFEYLTNLTAESNSFTEINWLHMPLLVELNLSNNLIQMLNLKVFNSCEKLKSLNLSRNKIERLPIRIFSVYLKNIISLDLSFNRLKSIPDRIKVNDDLGNILYTTVFYNLELDFLDISGNQMERFELNWIGGTKKCLKVSVRSSNISALDSDMVHTIVLDLSNNRISSRSWPWFYDEDLKLSGKISPFVFVENLEELYLAHNEITDIAIDFRIHNPNLRILDLSYNKIKYLTYQELLFSSYRFLDAYKKKIDSPISNLWYSPICDEKQEYGNIEPYQACHSLTVNLRNNMIGSIEFPHAMLVRNVTSKCEKHKYSRAIILLGNNPFECGCTVIPFLRVVEEDVVLTSELWRTEGISWLMQARIDATNLTCRYPESVKGKLVIATETWMHHLLPTMGFCYLSHDKDFIDVIK